MIKQSALLLSLGLSTLAAAEPDYMFAYVKTDAAGVKYFVFLTNLQGICDRNYAKCADDATHFKTAETWARSYAGAGLDLELGQLLTSRWVPMANNKADAIEMTFSLLEEQEQD